MHTNNKISLLIRASRLYCYSMYREHDPKYYPQIASVIRGFTNKLFGTKPLENRVKILILPQFQDRSTGNSMSQEYTGIVINMVFPDTSELDFELWAKPPITQAWTHSYKPKPVPAKA